MASCKDCRRPYGDQYGFSDLIIPYDAWKRISPTGDDGGLLCPSCICARLEKASIRCEGAFMSGPIISVSSPTMHALRRVENIELAIEGRNNRWSGVRKLVTHVEDQERRGVRSLPAAIRRFLFGHRLVRCPTCAGADPKCDDCLGSGEVLATPHPD